MCFFKKKLISNNYYRANHTTWIKINVKYIEVYLHSIFTILCELYKRHVVQDLLLFYRSAIFQFPQVHSFGISDGSQTETSIIHCIFLSSSFSQSLHLSSKTFRLFWHNLPFIGIVNHFNELIASGMPLGIPGKKTNKNLLHDCYSLSE